MSEKSMGKGLLVGFLAGGIAGAVVALLYAPKSGKEFREDIKTKSDGYLDEADKYLADAKDKAREVINEGKKKSDKLISDAKVKSAEILKDAEKVFNDAKVKASGLVETGKGTIGSETSKLKEAVKAGVDAYKNTKEA